MEKKKEDNGLISMVLDYLWDMMGMTSWLFGFYFIIFQGKTIGIILLPLGLFFGVMSKIYKQEYNVRT